MKKVCLVTSTHSPLDDRIFYKEARTLRKHGYRVTIICSTKNINKTIDGIKIKGFAVDPFLLKIKIGRICEYIKIFQLCKKENGDIYHCYALNVLLPCLILKKKVINEVLEWYPENYIGEGRWKAPEMYLRKFFDKIVNQKVDIIIAGEELKGERYIQYTSKEKVVIIPEYPPLDLFKPHFKDFAPSKFVLAYQGYLSIARGICQLIKSCVLFSNRKNLKPMLLIMGKFATKRDKKEIFKLLSENQKLVKYKFLGWVPHPEVGEKLKEADVCFLLWQPGRIMHTQAVPVKIFEYMACGKPIIASNLPILRKIVEENKCGICVNPLDEWDIAKAIIKYFEDPSLMLTHGSNGRAAVEQKYNWQIVENRLLEVYRELL